MWKAMYESEAKKFQQETRRTSEYSALLRRILDYFEVHGYQPKKHDKCKTCKLMLEIEALLEKPLNES
jgi:hypothetical protein